MKSSKSCRDYDKEELTPRQKLIGAIIALIGGGIVTWLLS